MHKMHRRKQPFILLEVLLGILLLTAFSGYLLRIPIKMCQKDAAMIQTFAQEQIFSLMQAEISENFYLNRYPWTMKPSPYKLKKRWTVSPSGEKSLATCSFSVTKSVEKPGKKGGIYQKLSIQMQLKDASGSHRSSFIFLRKKEV